MGSICIQIKITCLLALEHTQFALQTGKTAEDGLGGRSIA